ncbi:hypothetical protein EGW08_016767 [Elysia chlorotica]|uniref:Uncharacterized protein n=1 Tax=Elysia chlorotica TaxID=188477 RepID=A0A3S1B3W8_ELYCH|nr:hypothetical protein EGW08_016767 [Elysia chlorotica]
MTESGAGLAPTPPPPSPPPPHPPLAAALEVNVDSAPPPSPASSLHSPHSPSLLTLPLPTPNGSASVGGYPLAASTPDDLDIDLDLELDQDLASPSEATSTGAGSSFIVGPTASSSSSSSPFSATTQASAGITSPSRIFHRSSAVESSEVSPSSSSPSPAPSPHIPLPELEPSTGSYRLPPIPCPANQESPRHDAIDSASYPKGFPSPQRQLRSPSPRAEPGSSPRSPSPSSSSPSSSSPSSSSSSSSPPPQVGGPESPLTPPPTPPTEVIGVQGAGPSSPCQRTFREAVSAGNTAELRRILQEREGKVKVNVNLLDPEGQTALHHGCLHGNLELVKLLVRFGADVRLANRDGWAPLHLAVHAGHADVMLFLLALQQQSNDQGAARGDRRT